MVGKGFDDRIKLEAAVDLIGGEDVLEEVDAGKGGDFEGAGSGGVTINRKPCIHNYCLSSYR